MSKTFFISDLHLGHTNCLKFDNRPFPNIQANDSTIVANWNNTVSNDDTVWILGDISWYNPEKTYEIYKNLNGTKNLVIGNHDRKLLKNQKVRTLFSEIADYKEIYLDNGCGIVLNHYPIMCYNHLHHGWYHLYGHVHNSLEWQITEKVKHEVMPEYGKSYRAYNVGCMIDYMNYTPRTFEEITENSTVCTDL